jgi:hypothetical protein
MCPAPVEEPRLRVVHLYPFSPLGRHGGTLRLAAAVDASAEVGDSEIHYFDRVSGGWRGPADRTLLESVRGGREGGWAPRRSLKRRLFPSTLWESGLRARRALGRHADRLAIDSATLIFLHTTYLAGSLPLLGPGALGSVVDVYDLVWRAHQNDAGGAGAQLSTLRRTYARAVRPREEAALRRADAVLVAGYEDRALLSPAIPAARWVPTSTPVTPVAAPPPGRSPLRVGMLGNFAHISTRQSAERLLRSPLAGDQRVRLVFAGLHARSALSSRTGIEVIGPVARVEDFYARVDCVAAPVMSGSGIKCKLGEALLAGRPVVTTRLGAAGFSPDLRHQFAVCAPERLDFEVVRRAVASFDPAAAREDAARTLAPSGVVERYRNAITDVAERLGARSAGSESLDEPPPAGSHGLGRVPGPQRREHG